MTRTFRTRPEAYAEIRRRLFLRSLPLGLLAGGIVAFLYLSTRTEAEGSFGLLLPALVFGGIVLFATVRVLLRYRRFFRSFTLEVSEREVTRRVDSVEPLTLHAYDISSIEEDKSGALVIRGREPRQTIVVPAQIANREELLEQLNSLQPVTIGVVATRYEKARALRGLLRLVSILLVITVQNDALFLFSAALALLLLGWDSYEVTRSGGTPSRRTSRLAVNAVLLLVVLILAWSHWYLKP